jgi:recombination protein RecA
MITPSALRLQIESTLSRKIPSAFTPVPKRSRPVAATGIESLDGVLRGGLPVGAMSEMVGPECSGRTAVALSYLAQMTQVGKVCCWIDLANTFDPASAAAAGVDLKRLLWVRCGVAQTRIQRDARNFVLPEKYLIPPPAKKRLHGGGFGPHPRTEVNGLSEAVTGLLRPEAIAPRCAEPQRRVRQKQEIVEGQYRHTSTTGVRSPHPSKPWSRIEQALRSTDLLLQSGGFSTTRSDRYVPTSRILVPNVETGAGSAPPCRPV